MVVSKSLLTSGEFAALRNVNLNSLRYYEKQGLLTPAYVDPHTKYRYFRLEQLSTLDTILFFIEVGMPLKQLKEYIDSNGLLDQNSVLRDAEKAMEEKISSMQLMLETTRFDLKNLEQNRWCNEQEGVFTREIGERYFIIKPYEGEWTDHALREKEATELFHSIKDAGMLPSFPAGFLVRWEDGTVKYSLYVQVIRPALFDLGVIRVPRGNYSCLQFELHSDMDLPGLIERNLGRADQHPVIVHNIMKDVINPSSRYMEIQMYKGSASDQK